MIMTSPLFLHHRTHLSRITGLLVHGSQNSLHYAGLMTFVPLMRLNANCLNKASMAFLTIFGILARNALLHKWLNPKYHLVQLLKSIFLRLGIDSIWPSR
jgi:hypothetical protein